MRRETDIVTGLLRKGRQLLDAPRASSDFETGIPKAEMLLNDLGRYPHMFVLGCVMDRQIKFGRAWAIPYRMGKKVGGFKFSHFRKLTLTKTKKLFIENSLHRFNTTMAGCFHSAIAKIARDYSGDASKIWSGNPSSAAVIRRFLEFDGVGIKIASMAANILVREFKVPMRDLSSIDISPDSRVTRYFEQNGLIRCGASREEVIFRARELSPSFPGLLDIGAFADGARQQPLATRRPKGPQLA